MKIAIAQIEALKGDIERNLNKHVAFIDEALKQNVDLIMFPELSLTGYEPELAKNLATHSEDSRLDALQTRSDQQNIIICAGLPTKLDEKLFISMVIFQPYKQRITYSKQYLYPTEVDVFTPGNTPCVIAAGSQEIVAPAICYELSNAAHAENAQRMDATVYMASVLDSVGGVDADSQRLSQIASTYKMITFMSNYVGCSGGYKCAGKSSVWNSDGQLLAQLDDKTEGLLIYDTETKFVNELYY